MSELFQTPAVVQSVATLVDGGTKLAIVTQELAPSEMTRLFVLKGKLGWMVFSESPIKESDIPQTPVEKFAKNKSPSERLYNSLYVFWDTQTTKTTPFDSWYIIEMDKFIKRVQEKLPERDHASSR